MSTQASIFDILDPPKLTPEQVAPCEAVTLRPYQSDSVDSVFREWETSDATLVCLPTGCGKSVVFSEVMRRICGDVSS